MAEFLDHKCGHQGIAGLSRENLSTELGLAFAATSFVPTPDVTVCKVWVTKPDYHKVASAEAQGKVPVRTLDGADLFTVDFLTKKRLGQTADERLTEQEKRIRDEACAEQEIDQNPDITTLGPLLRGMGGLAVFCGKPEAVSSAMQRHETMVKDYNSFGETFGL